MSENDAGRNDGPCVSSIDVKGLPAGVFPGRLPREELRICVAPGAHAAMRKHAGSSLDREVCGVMLGQLKKDAGGAYLAIEDVIEGQEAQGEAARVTFTPEAWDAIFKEQERRDPNLKMVGWYHTHPRFGIFLSQYDRFIHENFFAVEPFMVAFVLDPVRDEEGFFFWSKGAIRRAERHWIGDQPRRGDGAEFDARVMQNDEAPARPPSRRIAAAPLAATVTAPPQGEPLPGLLTTYIVLGLAAVFMAYLGWTMLVPSRTDRSLSEIRRLQEHMILIQGDLAAELRELRAHLGMKPAERQSLAELERLRQKLLERVAEQQRAGARRDEPATPATSSEPSEKDAPPQPPQADAEKSGGS